MLKFVKKFAEGLDTLRVFPRLFIGIYIYLLYSSATWFMLLENPNNAQAGLISVIVGAGAGFFGLYVNSGKGSKNSKD